MSDQAHDRETSTPSHGAANTAVDKLVVAIEYAIVLSLLIVAGIVLVRTMIDFFDLWHAFTEAVVGAIDGILVVIILLDIVHTVSDHLRRWSFAIRPFLVIGVLAGVRDILSTSARLSLDTHLSGSAFKDTLIALSVGVGVVVMLVVGLLLLRWSGHADDDA